MKKKSSFSLISIFSNIARYKLTIFIVVFVGGLVAGVLILNQILEESSNTTGVTTTLDNTSFDQTTIDRVNKLQTSNQPRAGFTIPSARYNPFDE